MVISSSSGVPAGAPVSGRTAVDGRRHDARHGPRPTSRPGTNPTPQRKPSYSSSISCSHRSSQPAQKRALRPSANVFRGDGISKTASNRGRFLEAAFAGDARTDWVEEFSMRRWWPISARREVGRPSRRWLSPVGPQPQAEHMFSPTADLSRPCRQFRVVLTAEMPTNLIDPYHAARLVPACGDGRWTQHGIRQAGSNVNFSTWTLRRRRNASNTSTIDLVHGDREVHSSVRP
jgi:hypothetical protein